MIIYNTVPEHTIIHDISHLHQVLVHHDCITELFAHVKHGNIVTEAAGRQAMADKYGSFITDYIIKY